MSSKIEIVDMSEKHDINDYITFVKHIYNYHINKCEYNPQEINKYIENVETFLSSVKDNLKNDNNVTNNINTINNDNINIINNDNIKKNIEEEIIVEEIKKNLTKIEEYQQVDLVYINILIKNLTEDKFNLSYSNRILTINVDGYNELNIELYDNVIYNKDNVKISPIKVEIKLIKEMNGLWPSIRKIHKYKKASPYSRSDPDKWYTGEIKQIINDTINEIREARAKDPNQAFQQIYADHDLDIQRAMAKSMLDSNGRCLSTSWKDVSKKSKEDYEKELRGEKTDDDEDDLKHKHKNKNDKNNIQLSGKENIQNYLRQQEQQKYYEQMQQHQQQQQQQNNDDDDDEDLKNDYGLKYTVN